jgi:hypothetical protein
MYIYGSTNDLMRGIIKINSSEANPALNSEKYMGLPLPWKVLTMKKVIHAERKKHALYELLATKRISGSDLFRMGIVEFTSLMNLMDGEPEETKECELSTLLKDGQLVRHSIGESTYSGTYNAERNAILCNHRAFHSLTRFVLYHCSIVQPGYTRSTSWKDCEIEHYGIWSKIIQ